MRRLLDTESVPVRLVGTALLSLGLCGCGGVWDQISRRDIPFTARVHGLFVKEDPLVVLRDSKDGDDRAKALRRLREPRQHGGSEQEQDTVVAILVTSAKSDPQPLCRLAAIEVLGHFQDPRAVQGLIDAYYQATTFAPDTATVIQCEALTALGKTRHPAAVDLLARVVRAPEPAFDVASLERQQEQDRRIAAARALGHFSHYQAAEALVYVLKTNSDVALRQRAHESLVQATGKKLPPEANAWENFLAQQGSDAPRGRDSGIKLLSWFRTE